MSRTRTVITGIGVVSPLGIDLVSFWESLHKGRSAVGPLRGFDASPLPLRFGAEVHNFDAREYLDKKERKRLSIMVRTFQFAVAAAQLAVADAHVDKTQIDPTRFGVIFGSSTVPSELRDLGQASYVSTIAGAYRVDLAKWGEHGLSAIPPMWMLSHIPNMAASHVSILHNAQGPNNTITQSELGAALAVGEAMRHIHARRADLFLIGGGDTLITPVNFINNILYGRVSLRNDAPEKASRPFDLERDGKVLGEGAGVLVIEEAEHARRRGARIYAEVAGFGAAFDGSRGDGLARAVREALRQAEVSPADIGHINAQGTSTIVEDACEARGLAEVFGPHMPPVFALKSYCGALGAGSAAVELAASLLSLENGMLPANLNYDYPDPSCPINVCRAQRPVGKGLFLKVTRTELGQCAAIVCRKWDR